MTGPDLYRKARARIPGGTQLLSTRPEMFLPEQWPAVTRYACISCVSRGVATHLLLFAHC